jgi:hypothetical protein
MTARVQHEQRHPVVVRATWTDIAKAERMLDSRPQTSFARRVCNLADGIEGIGIGRKRSKRMKKYRGHRGHLHKHLSPLKTSQCCQRSTIETKPISEFCGARFLPPAAASGFHEKAGALRGPRRDFTRSDFAAKYTRV